MTLVSAKEVAKAVNIEKLGFLGTFIGWILMRVLNISAINKVYEKHKHLSDLDFMNALLDEYEIKFEIPKKI